MQRQAPTTSAVRKAPTSVRWDGMRPTLCKGALLLGQVDPKLRLKVHSHLH
jgi:hypothetical protein